MYNEYGDELTHYGVLGMKWGQRRAAKRGSTYKYTSDSTKAYQKAANKYARKAKRGSLHAIIGTAKQDMGFKKSANKSFARSENKQAKWKAKSEAYSKKAKASQKYDDLHSNYAKNKAKVGTTLLANALVNPRIVDAYQQMRATGTSKGKAAAQAFLFGEGASIANRNKYIKKHAS